MERDSAAFERALAAERRRNSRQIATFRLGAVLTVLVLQLLFGALWSLWLPLNKNLWTSSFVLWTAGWATLALLAFHWLIDRHGWPAWGRRFGVNAIAAYAGSELMQILLSALGWNQPIYQHLFAGWMTPHFGPYVPSLAFAIAFVTVWWLIVWAMDRRRVYLKL